MGDAPLAPLATAVASAEVTCAAQATIISVIPEHPLLAGSLWLHRHLADFLEPLVLRRQKTAEALFSLSNSSLPCWRRRAAQKTSFTAQRLPLRRMERCVRNSAASCSRLCS